MGFTVRFLLGTVLVLLCSWSAQTTELNRRIDDGSTEATEKTQAESKQESIVANLTEEFRNKPKTDLSTENNTTNDKQINLAIKPSGHFDKLPENGRSIDIEKYISKDFHNKNNVYSVPVSPDTEKFLDPDFAYSATTHRHVDYTNDFDIHAELTTPKSALFDDRYKEAVESVGQKLEHIDDFHEESSESASKDVNLEEMIEETKRNDTEADLDYTNYKNIIGNNTGSKNSRHKDLVVEAGTNLDFRSSYNHTIVIDEDDSGNNTIAKEAEEEKKVEASTLSNIIPVKGDLEHAESVTSKNIVLTTRKSIVVTKPPSNKNASHISILSNKIETETVKAILSTTTPKSKGDAERVVETFTKKAPIAVSKRFFVFANVSTEPTNTNAINKTSEQLQQENQVIPVNVEAPQIKTGQIKESNQTKDVVPNSIELIKEQESTTKIPEVIQTTAEQKPETTTDVPTVTTVRVTTKIDDVVESTESTTIIPETEATTVRPTETTTNLSTVEVTEVTTSEPEKITLKESEVETVTSVVTETSVSPWERVTFAMTELQTTTATEAMSTVTAETERASEETETTAFQSDSTAAPTTDDLTTTEVGTTTQLLPVTVKNLTSTTENLVRTSKEMVFREVTTAFVPTTITEKEVTETTTPVAVTSEKPEVTTTPPLSEVTLPVTLEVNRSNVEMITVEVITTVPHIPVTNAVRIIPDFKPAEVTDSSDFENSTEINTGTSEFYENTEPPEDNSGMIAAITISSIGAVCLILLAALLVIMRKRQKRFNYGQRCTPLSLDDYSMDNVSVYNSVRRKGLNRSSKRSYGNPAFEDPSSVTHPLNFPSLGKFATNLEDIRAEFEEIPQITARINELPDGCDTKNRYANVIPLPETRVFLSVIEGQANSDYINANYVTGPKNTKGYYIACQAPMQNTVDDFWRMVWEQQTKVILMLTHLFENSVEKCVDYLPPSEVLDCHRLFGDFQVTLKKREVKDKYIISCLQLKNMVSNSWREVTHFWYLGWPEKGVPSEANSLIAFLIEARSYMKSSSLERKEVDSKSVVNGAPKNELNPVVVHCSPGTGRTGVVIACDIAIREFEQTRLVDVPRIVYKIRRDRASAVQTKEQYAFIYKVVSLYATKLTGGALDSL